MSSPGGRVPQANATKTFESFLLNEHLRTVRELAVYRQAWQEAEERNADLERQLAEMGQRLVDSTPASRKAVERDAP